MKYDKNYRADFEKWFKEFHNTDEHLDFISETEQYYDYTVNHQWSAWKGAKQDIQINQDIPVGAIINAQESCRRLIDFYDFQCEAGSLGNCYEMLELQRCLYYITDCMSNLQKESEKDG